MTALLKSYGRHKSEVEICHCLECQAEMEHELGRNDWCPECGADLDDDDAEEAEA